MNPKDKVGSKKAPLGLVPPALEIGAAEAMANGAAKYGPFNWREQAIEYMSYLVAIKRHVNALIDGEDFAADSGIHHLHHIAAGVGILIDAKGMPNGLIDNRPPRGPAAAMLAAQDKSAQPANALPKVYPVTLEEAGTWFTADNPYGINPTQKVTLDVTCIFCRFASPAHAITCPYYWSGPDLDTSIPYIVKTEAWGDGDGDIYSAVEALDGCYEYRGIHVHPSAANEATYRDIDLDIQAGLL